MSIWYEPAAGAVHKNVASGAPPDDPQVGSGACFVPLVVEPVFLTGSEDERLAWGHAANRSLGSARIAAARTKAVLETLVLGVRRLIGLVSGLALRKSGTASRVEDWRGLVKGEQAGRRVDYPNSGRFAAPSAPPS